MSSENQKDEIICEWLKMMYEAEIEEAKEDIRNQRLWEIGYDGVEPNPHTENIARLLNYIEVLNGLIEKINVA